MAESWDRQAGETEEWYDRFRVYLYMGPDRTPADAHRFATRFAIGTAPRGLPPLGPVPAHGRLSSWQRAARRNRWQARAADFDAELCRKALGRDERMKMVAELLRQVYAVLHQADMLTLSKEEARRLLPTFRLFFKDLLAFYQSEAAKYFSAQESAKGGESNSAVDLTADDLAKHVRDSGGWRSLLAEIEQVTNVPVPFNATQAYVAGNATQASLQDKRVACNAEPVTLAAEASWGALWAPLRDVLAQLYPDEASARRLVAQTQLDSARIHFATRAVDTWHAILTEAAHAGHLEAVIKEAKKEYRRNKALADAVKHYRQLRVQGKRALARRKST